MIFWISFSNVLHFTRHERRGHLIPEGFVLETPPERKPTPLQFTPESPTFYSIPPIIPQSPMLPPASLGLDTTLGPVILIGNDSTETLVNVITQPVFPTPILQHHPRTHETLPTRRISFAVCATPERSVKPPSVIDVDQVPCKPCAAAGETSEQGEYFKENVPEVEKISRRKSIARALSLRGSRTSRTKAHRFSVPVFTSLTDALSKRASKRL
ncbi:uncharacterized protein EDB91DRAFT_1252238 [Suillus paluster]|uniref:uncharacterized protein n=1 Tax=Suillus paluster TaxID=48578 RepID=UPI001B860BBE|nr:uncharacterized protein EDB91DRAFT_889588 [Suillus paluster]XP_041173493.1 uncharacterized protein EDB91DRAFT_1252238 [Suillus paluster]KAG1727553.1 hypothetical protein EDB91DRAFT_889588 [Suillus paluster]KAG1731365.1 hypothetical protein EDB91DRAFT_1252238 [Suillus paluster]